jgi:hypothetical protein
MVDSSEMSKAAILRLGRVIKHMLTFKGALYLLTFTCALVFGFWESRLKRQMTEGLLRDNESVGDMGLLSSVTEEIKREELLKKFPPEKRSKLNMIVSLKLLCFFALILEVALLQR